LTIYNNSWAYSFTDTVLVWETIQPLNAASDEVFSHYDGVALEGEFGGAASAALVDRSYGSLDSRNVFFAGNDVHVDRP